MRTYEEASALAKIYARQARLAASKDVAADLWRMAREWQTQAAKLNTGKLPDIGEPPPGVL